MKKLIFILIVAAVFFSCEDDYYIDTGLSNGELDVTMWDYFKTDSYNWDSTMLVISRAGLESVFNGENSVSSKITFLGVTNHSIRKFMLDNNYATVDDISVEICKDYILSYVIADEYLWNEIEFEVKGTTSGEGGITVLVSTNIQTTTGVVHALSYTHTFGPF